MYIACIFRKNILYKHYIRTRNTKSLNKATEMSINFLYRNVIFPRTIVHISELSRHFNSKYMLQSTTHMLLETIQHLLDILIAQGLGYLELLLDSLLLICLLLLQSLARLLDLLRVDLFKRKCLSGRIIEGIMNITP